MARNIKSYIKKVTLVFQEEGKEAITIEVQQASVIKDGKIYEAYAPEIDGSKVCFATEPVKAARKAFEAAVVLKEGE